MPKTTCEDLDRLNKEMLAVVDSKNLSHAVALVVAMGLLTSVIRACKAEAGLPSTVGALEPLLEKALGQGVRVVTAPDEQISAMRAAVKARMN